MIVVMKPDATAAQIEHMATHITSLGLTPQVIQGTHQTVIAALGEERPGLTEVLEPGEGVEKVLPIMAPYKRASSELKRERTVVKARRARGRRHSRRRHRRTVLGRERGADCHTGATAQSAWARPACAAGRSSRGPARTASRGTRSWASRCWPRPRRRPAWRS